MIGFFVMAGVVPAIHVFLVAVTMTTWMPGTSPGMTSFATSPRTLLEIPGSRFQRAPE
jgi:hypothetical protein